MLKKLERNLPATLTELHEYILIGREALKAAMAKIRAIDKVSKSKAAKEAALLDTQDAAEYLLCAEVKLGEMLEAIPDKKASSGAGTRSLPNGINKKDSHFAQQLAAHQDIVEEVIAKAREEERIPTSWEVLKTIYKKEKKETSNEPIFIDGLFKTIVVDPPWPIDQLLREERPMQNADPYPTMTIEALKNSKLPFADDCHVYLWTTTRFMRDAFEIFDAWGIKFLYLLVWCKNVGFTVYGGFMNNAEFVLFGRKGNLPLLKVGEKVVFNGQVREHSRKPEEFYNLVRLVSPEPRIDCFSREKRDGFEQWGNETEFFKVEI